MAASHAALAARARAVPASIVLIASVLSADAPAGTPPKGTQKRSLDAAIYATTTVSSNDGILTTGSLPAALLLPAAISSGCAHLMPPCALRSLTFAAHLARSLRVPPQRSSDAVERAAEKRTAVEGTAIAHASCYKPSQLRC